MTLRAGGDAQGIRRLYSDYTRIFLSMLDDGFVDIDQVLLALVATEAPDYLRALPSNFYGVADLC